VFVGSAGKAEGTLWTVVQIVSLLTIVGFAVAAYGVWRDALPWEGIAIASAVVGLLATAAYGLAVRDLSGAANVLPNLVIHGLGRMAVLLVLLVPAARQLIALKEVRGDPAIDANRWASKIVFRRVRGQAGEEAEHAVDGRLRCCPEIQAVASLRGNIAGIPGIDRGVSTWPKPARRQTLCAARHDEAASRVAQTRLVVPLRSSGAELPFDGALDRLA